MNRLFPDGDVRTLTLVGPLTTRPPAPASALPPLPASDEELGDLVHNALQRFDDRLALSHSDEHLVAVLERSQRIEDDRDVGRDLLRAAAAELQNQAVEIEAARSHAAEVQALTAALGRERETVAELAVRAHAEAVHAAKLHAQVAGLASEADAARRSELRACEAREALKRALADALAELSERDRVQSGAQRRHPGPPARWPTSTDPANETVVVDVPMSRGAR